MVGIEAERRLTVLWHEIPPWQQDNHYIVSGYRPATNSYRRSLASLGYLHNEYVNVYTHLAGAVLAISCAALLRAATSTAPATDVAVFACFFVGAAGCLAMSATYHLLANHSAAVARRGNALDYLGIVALIWGSFVPSIYYGFHDRPALVRLYWTMISTLGAGCATVSLSGSFRTPPWRPLRAAMFVGMGLSALVPVAHGLCLYGVDRMHDRIGLRWLLLQGFLYVLGALIYATRIPERWQPGRFDIWGSSHQIFHLLVVLAAAAHFVGLSKAFNYWQAADTRRPAVGGP